MKSLDVSNPLAVNTKSILSPDLKPVGKKNSVARSSSSQSAKPEPLLEVNYLDEDEIFKQEIGSVRSLAPSVESVESVDLFCAGKDTILFEGPLHKFKPGISLNFIERYVQVSERAFRYFKDFQSSKTRQPIVQMRKKLL